MFPVLALVEDDSSEYEPVPLADDENVAGTVPGAKDSADNAPRLSLDNGPVTSSFRATNRLFRANGGFAAYTRGFLCLGVFNVANVFLAGIFISAIGPLFAPVALLLTSLALG